MISVIFTVEGTPSVNYDMPAQFLVVDKENIIESLGRIISRIKFPFTLLILNSDFPQETTVKMMLTGIGQKHALLFKEGNNVLLNEILFNSKIFKIVVKQLLKVNWESVSGLVRGLGKAIVVDVGAKEIKRNTIFLKMGRIPEKLNMQISHYFWLGAYSRFVGMRRKHCFTLATAVRSFLAEAEFYKKKKLYNLEEMARRDSTTITQYMKEIGCR